ncbi:MAG: FG-GAP-like repeat-containing protein [Rubripirellula sp.]|nr:FG-GAP-like repeat-containing protein [Rubripirellula sp.]
MSISRSVALNNPKIKNQRAFALVLPSVWTLLALVLTGCHSREQEGSADSSIEFEESLATADNSSAAVVNPRLAGPRSARGELSSPSFEAESVVDTSLSGSDADDRTTKVAIANELINAGKLAEASQLLKRMLLVDPDDVQVLFMSARLAADQGELAEAIELLREIPEGHPEAGLPAIGQSAEWCLVLERYDEAEIQYRKLLAAAPDVVPALRQLAFLLNRQGRRQEAAVLVRQLCVIGDVLQDELHSLIALGDAMYDSPANVVANAGQRTSNGVRHYLPISPFGDARKAFQENDFEQVMELLRPSIESSTAPPAMVALFGRAACEQQDDSAVHWWQQQLPAGIEEFADYWATLGTLELMEQRYESAVRAFAESLMRDGTDMDSMSRMRQALGSLGKETEAQLWFDRWTQTRAVIDANNAVAATKVPNPVAVETLASELDQLDRPLEALMWRVVKTQTQQGAAEAISALGQQYQQLLRSQQPFPDPSSLRCGLDLQRYPLPNAGALPRQGFVEPVVAGGDGGERVIPAVFENVAGTTGLSHVYRVAGEPIKRHYSIHQTLGGGVAILDYDRDGWPDMYFAQGGSDPPQFQGKLYNQLFRNQGKVLVEVATQSAADVRQYSLGVAAGDWNQDGFPDLAVANIGTCLLLTNNGDGTFTERSLEKTADFERVPASICIADVTADGLPEVIQIGYVDDPDMSIKPPLNDNGNVSITVAPSNFGGAIDCLFKNLGDGDFAYEGLTDLADARTGLGIVVADFDQQSGNEIFIGNDSLPNRLWKLGVESQSVGRQVDLAPVLGCAYGFSGGATGAMGIAVADFDGDSRMDFHVTNYENESSNLYIKRDRAFQDRNRQYKLGESSREWVGFGTQAIDYDHDSDVDLLVANGHLDDAISIRGTFAQPLQLFCNRGRTFEELEVTDDTGYWNVKHVGRSLASLDFDRDGLTDVVMTNVEEPSALILNRTRTPNHWLQVALVGTLSDRDAVGAEVVVKLTSGALHAWNVAGDGYLSSNEKVVSFGLGNAASVERLTVRWPNDTTQIFNDVAVDQRLIVIENEPLLFLQH